MERNSRGFSCADRGGVKAYRVNDTPTRGESLHLVQAFDITDAHGRYNTKLTDQAGRFPVSDGNGRHANSVAEGPRSKRKTTGVSASSWRITSRKW